MQTSTMNTTHYLNIVIHNNILHVTLLHCKNRIVKMTNMLVSAVARI